MNNNNHNHKHKKNNQNSVAKLTGFDWAKTFGIELIDFVGFPSKESYMSEKITKDIFLLAAANCKINHSNQSQTRKAAMKFRRGIEFA